MARWLLLLLLLLAVALQVAADEDPNNDGSVDGERWWERDDDFEEELQRMLREVTEPPPTEPPADPPAPTQLAPTEPTPTEPKPTEPMLTEPTPTEPAPTEPEPMPPMPSPTPDPNIPPGMEEMALLAFRLEYAEDDTLATLMEWAYDWVARDRGYEDGVLLARDIPDFLHRALNPAEEDIEDDERALLRAASDELREEQGLHVDSMPVFIGFLSRGSPVRYVRQLAHDMHHQNRARRRLKEAAEDQDRDL